MPNPAERRYDILAIGAHPDDLEVVMGGTAIKFVRKGFRVLFVDLCDGEQRGISSRGTPPPGSQGC